MIIPYFIPGRLNLSEIVSQPGPETGYDAMPGVEMKESDNSEKKEEQEFEEYYSDMRQSCLARILCLESRKRIARTQRGKDRINQEIQNLWDLLKSTYRTSYQAEMADEMS